MFSFKIIAIAASIAVAGKAKTTKVKVDERDTLGFQVCMENALSESGDAGKAYIEQLCERYRVLEVSEIKSMVIVENDSIIPAP